VIFPIQLCRMPPKKYMPLCECGKTHLTDLRSDGELERWARRRGDCWDYNELGRPFWFLCLPCHGRRWPNDRRWGNRHDSPAPPWLHTVQKGVRHHQLLPGDFFYLTTPPPERERACGGPGRAGGRGGASYMGPLHKTTTGQLQDNYRTTHRTTHRTTPFIK
jgi:hypothetical protein